MVLCAADVSAVRAVLCLIVVFFLVLDIIGVKASLGGFVNIVGGLKKCKGWVAFILCPTSKPDLVYWLCTVVVRVVKKLL
jgi:hypothetical protein